MKTVKSAESKIHKANLCVESKHRNQINQL